MVSSRDAVIRLSASIMWERGSVQKDGVQVLSQECAQARASEQCENIPVPLIKEDTVEVVQVIPQERLRARIAEQSVPIPGPPAKEDIAGVVQGLPPEHDQRRVAEQSVHFPVPPINSSSVPSVPTHISSEMENEKSKDLVTTCVDPKGACWKSEILADATC